MFVVGRAPAGLVRESGSEKTEPGPLVLIASPVTGLHKRWREAIQHAFATDQVTGYAQFLEGLPDRRPGVVLLDLCLPGMDGVRSLAALRRASMETRIVLLTSRPGEREGIVALKAGARGYCDREIDPALLGKAVDAVHRGEIRIGRKLTSYLLDELRTLAERAPAKAQPRPALPVDTGRSLGRLTRVSARSSGS